MVSRRVYRRRLLNRNKGKISKYFNQFKTCKERKRWIPPRSPYNLIQEDLFYNPWQLLIATIFLNKTQARNAVPQILKFLNKWPTAQSLLSGKQEEVIDLLAPLGIQKNRSATIIKFTKEFLEKNWNYPEELYGIGKYGNDSYRMFCVNEWKVVTPCDNKLILYKNWLEENEKQLGILESKD